MNPFVKEIARQLLPPYAVTVARRLRELTGLRQSQPVAVPAIAADSPPAAPPAPQPSASPMAVVRALIAPEPPEWEAVPDSAEVWTAHAGWSHESIAEIQRQRWPEFIGSLNSTRPLGWRDTKPGDAVDVGTHNTLISFGYVLGLAGAERERASILDWGGGLGQYARYAALLQPQLDFAYTVKDLPSLCRLGRELNPAVAFVDDDERALSRQYDLVFASSSLQYTRDLYGLLARLCDATAGYLYITRTPFVQNHDDFVVVQRPYRYGYQTEYPCWFINSRRFTEFVLARGLLFEREFMLAERPFVPNAPEPCIYSGFLFRRSA